MVFIVTTRKHSVFTFLLVLAAAANYQQAEAKGLRQNRQQEAIAIPSTGLEVAPRELISDTTTSALDLLEARTRTLNIDIVNYQSGLYLVDGSFNSDQRDSDPVVVDNPLQFFPLQTIDDTSITLARRWRFRPQDNCPDTTISCYRIQNTGRYLLAKEDDLLREEGVVVTETTGTITANLGTYLGQEFGGSFIDILWDIQRTDCDDGSGQRDCAFIVNLANGRRLSSSQRDGSQVGSVSSTSQVLDEQKWKLNIFTFW